MHLIVGLGNPGKKYAANRHNIGAMAVDEIARAHGFEPFRKKFSGLFADGRIEGKRTLLLKPQTFMNNSGESVQAAASFFKLDPCDISVIYDELDLAPGKVRIKTGGGNGGHNGLRSIDPRIGRDYQRIRLGIGHPGHKELVTRHVLSDFHKIDHEWLDPLLDAIGKNAALIVSKDASGLMNKLALAVQQADERALRGEKSPPRHSETPQKQPDTSARNQTGPDKGPLAAALSKLFSKE
ncbi:MAG TPA: aminoacyl-tRNA hydrolase [Devosia sp.]|nr:aminoacyl-tRNA hydrolase [Devosia sp.]